MSFGAQRWLTFWLACAGAGVAVAALAAGRGAVPEALYLAGLAICAGLLFFGILIRGVQRWLWFRTRGGDGPRWPLRGPLRRAWAWWLHVDAGGNDRDRRA